MEAAEHGDPHPSMPDPAIHSRAAAWWEARREIRPGAAWDVPFPPRATETVRLTHDAAGGMWYAALIRPRALTAYIEVHSADGPVAALVSLYEHVA